MGPSQYYVRAGVGYSSCLGARWQFRIETPDAVTAVNPFAPPPPPPPPSGPPLTPPPPFGTYQGIGYQHSDTGAVGDDDYRLRMTFGESEITVNYPDQGCAGTLVPAGRNGHLRVFDEDLVSGTCARGGHWTIKTLSSHEIRGTWTLPSHRYTVKTRLKR